MNTVKFKLPAIGKVDFEIECMPEDIDFVGNCSAIDEETDKKNESWIREQLDNGNEWAWCTVKMSAKYKGIEGTDYLGGCSYKSENDFKKDGYYKDMRQNAYNDLIDQLRKLND